MCRICCNSWSWPTETCQQYNKSQQRISLWETSNYVTLQIHWIKHRVRCSQNSIHSMRKSKAHPKAAPATTRILQRHSSHVNNCYRNWLKLTRSLNALKLIKSALSREFWRITVSKMVKRIRKKAHRGKALQIRICWLWQTMTRTVWRLGKGPRPGNPRMYLLTWASKATDRASQWKDTPATRANWACKREIPLSVRR